MRIEAFSIRGVGLAHSCRPDGHTSIRRAAKILEGPPRVIPEKSEAGGGVGYARGRGGVGPEVGATRSLTAAMYYDVLYCYVDDRRRPLGVVRWLS